ncbi:MAG: ferrous iron transport protein A [Butyrivibrio sp.]|nr:ferrous iron transport protein A [Butyrivibrio sp.]
MKLSEMKKDTSGTVKSLGTDEWFVKRIASIGLSEGASFRIVKNDKRMPVLIYARETLLALNRKDCEKIEAMEVMG